MPYDPASKRVIDQLPPAPQSHWSTLLPWIGGAISDTLAPQQRLWNQEASTLLGRELTPLSVGQVPEQYRQPLATPDQYTKAPPVMEPSSVPSYQPSALDFSMRQSPTGSPLTPSFGSPAPDLRQGFGRSPLTPPTPQPHFQAEQGPPQQIERDVLDPTKPANPWQREAVKSQMELASKWPPGMAAQTRDTSKQKMAFDALMTRDPDRDPAQAWADAGFEISGMGRAGINREKENRLGHSSDVREELGRERLRLQGEGLKIRRDALLQTKRRIDFLNSQQGKSQDLAREKFEHQKAFDETKIAIYELMKDPESLDEESKNILRGNIAAFAAGGDYDITQEIPPGLLNQLLPGWNIGTPKTTLKPKVKGAPQGAPSNTDQFPGAPPPGAPGSTLADKSGKPLARSDGKQWIPLQ